MEYISCRVGVRSAKHYKSALAECTPSVCVWCVSRRVCTIAVVVASVFIFQVLIFLLRLELLIQKRLFR